MKPIKWKPGVCDICATKQKKTTTIRGSTYCVTVCQECYGEVETGEISQQHKRASYQKSEMQRRHRLFTYKNLFKVSKHTFSPCYNPFSETGKCTLPDTIVEQLVGSGCQESRCSNCTIAHRAREYQEAGGSLDDVHKNPLIKKKVRTRTLKKA